MHPSAVDKVNIASAAAASHSVSNIQAHSIHERAAVADTSLERAHILSVVLLSRGM
jgi:hypothetical protein